MNVVAFICMFVVTFKCFSSCADTDTLTHAHTRKYRNGFSVTNFSFKTSLITMHFEICVFVKRVSFCPHIIVYCYHLLYVHFIQVQKKACCSLSFVVNLRGFFFSFPSNWICFELFAVFVNTVEEILTCDQKIYFNGQNG